MARLLFDANGVFIRRLEEPVVWPCLSESIPVGKPSGPYEEIPLQTRKCHDDSVDTQIYGLKASQFILDDPLKEGKEDA